MFPDDLFFPAYLCGYLSRRGSATAKSASPHKRRGLGGRQSCGSVKRHALRTHCSAATTMTRPKASLYLGLGLSAAPEGFRARRHFTLLLSAGCGPSHFPPASLCPSRFAVIDKSPVISLGSFGGHDDKHSSFNLSPVRIASSSSAWAVISASLGLSSHSLAFGNPEPPG